MAQTLSHRSENDIKNKWNSMMRKQKRSRNETKVDGSYKPPQGVQTATIKFRKQVSQVKPSAKGAKGNAETKSRSTGDVNGIDKKAVQGVTGLGVNPTEVDETLGLDNESFLKEALGMVEGTEGEKSAFGKGIGALKELPVLQENTLCAEEAAAGTTLPYPVEI